MLIQAALVEAQIVDAVAKGGKVLSGGQLQHHGGGLWLQPTVISDVDHGMTVMTEETFGPLMPVMAYSTIEQAVALANDSKFGLSAAVFGSSVEAAYEVGQHLEAGAVSLMDASLTGQYFEAGKQSAKQSGLGPSRMGDSGFSRFFRLKAYIANTGVASHLPQYSEDFVRQE